MNKTPLPQIFSKSILEKTFLEYCDNPAIQCISFDVFDTLVFRKVAFPHQVFLSVGEQPMVKEYFDYPENFHQQRVLAEKRARKSTTLNEVTLDRIYAEFSLPDEIRENIKQLELATEQELLVANSQTDRWIKIANDSGKRVICISDTYLDSTQLKRLALSKLHNDELIEHIFVSSEWNATKAAGDMFYRVLQELSVKPDQLLHIGDHRKSDFEIPKNIGANIIHYAASDNYYKVLSYENTYLRINDRCLNVARRLAVHQNPYVTDDKRFYFELGANVFAPVLYGFAYWLMQLAHKKGIKQVFMLMREGRLFRPCLEFIKQHHAIFSDIEIDLLYASRKSVLLPFMEGNENYFKYSVFNVKNLFDVFGLSIPEVLRPYEKCLLQDAEKIVLNNSGETLLRAIEALISQSSDKIKYHSAQQCGYLNRYLEGLACNRPLVVDYGGGGTVLKALQKNGSDRLRPGHNALMYRDVSGVELENLDVFFPVTAQTVNGLRTLKRSSGVIEFFLNGKAATTLSYRENPEDKRIEPVLSQRRSLSSDEMIDAFDHGIEVFFNVFEESFHGDAHHFLAPETRSQLAGLLTRLLDVPTKRELEVIGSLAYESDLEGNERVTFMGSDRQPDAAHAMELLSSHTALKWDIEWPMGWVTRHHRRVIENFMLGSYIDDAGSRLDVEFVADALKNLSAIHRQKVVIWGAGEFGSLLLQRLKDNARIEIVAVVDLRANVKPFKMQDFTVAKPADLLAFTFDVLVVASAAFKTNIIELYRSLCDAHSVNAKHIITC